MGEVPPSIRRAGKSSFKWVKQHLALPGDHGQCGDARVWVALCVYLLVAYVKFLLRPPGRLYENSSGYRSRRWSIGLWGGVGWEVKKGPKQAPKWRQRNLFGRRLKPLCVGG